MIYLPVSEAYACDYYAILLVKRAHRIKGVKSEIRRWEQVFFCQSWKVPLYQLVESKEFRELLSANEQVWDLVAKAANDQCKASEVDQANQRRFEAKKALQTRFWPDKPLSEVKAERPK